MADEWQVSSDQSGIARVEGVPRRNEEGQLSRREFMAFKVFVELVRDKLKDGCGLVEEFARAKVAQETNAARKLAEEAAETAAHREEIEANADLKRQEATGAFIKNLAAIQELNESGQRLALLKLIADNPAICEQLEKLEGIIETLKFTRNTCIESTEELPTSDFEPNELEAADHRKEAVRVPTASNAVMTGGVSIGESAPLNVERRDEEDRSVVAPK